MLTFIIALIVLVVGFFTYGTLVEKIFGIEPERKTPALTKTDGVDFVPMSPWRVFLVQFLNIAGLGPIFGAIMGIFYGPAAFLWIVFGTIFAGGVHDYLSGMLSIRKGGVSLPDIVGDELGQGTKLFMRVLSLVLLILLTTTFLSGPATLLQGLAGLGTMQFSGRMIPIVWVLIIFGYYALATVLPVDKLIGRFYPIFGGILLFMGLGIMVVMLGWHSGEMPEVFDGLQNRQTNGLPLFPMMFVSIACGAISGFHGTQSPIMARCVTNERQGRWIFYGAMVAEGILALIWAAAAGTFFADPEKGLYGIEGLQAFAAEHPGQNIAALVIDKVSRSWLGTVGGILAIIGVIAAPITSGDTALRSARLIVADFLKWDQRPIPKRLIIAIPLFLCVFGMVFVDFNVVWRYFAWTNQTLAVFTLWAGTIWLYKKEQSDQVQGTKYRYGYLIALIPALFMTMVCSSYILIAPEGLHIAPEYRWIGYLIAGFVTLSCLCGFGMWAKKRRVRGKRPANRTKNMKDFVRILMVLLLAGSSIHAEEITITTTITVNLSAQKNLVRLSLSEGFRMDSGWIVSASDTTPKVLVFHAQSGDYINVSKLERGYYMLYAQGMDTCVGKQFYKRDRAISKELDIVTADVQITAPHTLQYSLREAGKSEVPHVDSVWIVGKSYACAMPDTVYMRTTAQPGDDIDLQPLLGQTENEFQCVAWINGTDYWSNSFYYGGECEAYGEIEVHYTHINPHHLILDIKNAGEPASADSLWISSAYDNHRTLMTGTAVSDGDTIDLSPLVGMSEQEYLAWLRFGECVKVYAFDFNGLDYDYCLEAGVWWVHLETDNSAHVLRYYLRDYDNQDIQGMQVDSAWISTWEIEETPEYVCAVDAQPGEAINILPLKNGFYKLSVQVGECIVSMPFQAYKSQPEGIEGVQEDVQSAVKVIREGKIVIVRGGKAYTLTGQETRL